MEPSDDDLLPKALERGEELVVYEKAGKQRISGTTGKRYGMNWSEMLAAADLESPGYHETIDKMRRAGRIKGH